MFDADQPIKESSQDRLNRALFSKYLARSLLDHPDTQSLVVGLYGGFGSGKTSVLNLVVEELNFAASHMLDEDKPIVLNFNPWSYSGQHQLIYSFFRRLSSALRAAPFLKNSERIIHLLELYVSFFTQKPVPKALRSKRSFLEKITFAGREEIYAWESGRDLTLVKAELNELLSQQKNKIIIIIDNISRLHDYEIKQIFQIVKSIGDYANTCYLLAFDKTQVIHLLNKVDGKGSKEFIDKVIQLPFEIPPILQHDLENILIDRLLIILKIVPENTWNNEYWADIYYNSLKFFFKNCRDITRYTNILNFSYPRLRELVNPVDFFALTALEVFVPSVYAGIRENKDLFTDLFEQVYETDRDALQKDKLRLDEILFRNQEVPSEALLELLMHLFPRLRSIYKKEVTFYHSSAIARKLKRLSCPDLFDIYFRLSLQTSQMLHSELHTLLALAKDEVAFDHALTRLNQDNRINQFLDQLDGKILDDLPNHLIFSIVHALLDNGDLFPSGEKNALNLDTPMRIHRIIHRLLKRFDHEERFMLLQNAIAATSKSIYIFIHYLNIEGREHLDEEDSFLPSEFRSLLPEQLESLQKLAINRVQHWAENGRLGEHPQLFFILQAWAKWGSKEECREFVVKMTHTDRGLVAFLIATLDQAINQAMTQYHKDASWQQCLNHINFFIPAEDLIDHAKLLFEDNYFEKLSEKEQLALMIFLDLTKARTNKIIPKTNGEK